MRYKTVRAHPASDGSVFITLESHPQERLVQKTKPHSAGFYHYPETVSDTQALQELQTKLLLQVSDRAVDELVLMHNILDPKVPEGLVHKWKLDHRVVNRLRRIEKAIRRLTKLVDKAVPSVAAPIAQEAVSQPVSMKEEPGNEAAN
jgi:hypothetical protein